MKQFLCTTVAIILMAGTIGASAQQMPPAIGAGNQAGPHDNMGHPHGPPPNVTQAIQLLKQAKQQTGSTSIALINQAEELLKRPPPPHNGPGNAGMGMGSNGGAETGGAKNGTSQPPGTPPPQE